MESTYSRMSKWMDRYFADYNRYGGDTKTLPKMLKYYLPDIELHSYVLNARRPHNLERILFSMTHPGLHEEFTPNYYVVDVRRKVIVAQLRNQFSEETDGTIYPPKQLSVHYYLVNDRETGFKIEKILFFAETRPADEVKMPDIIRAHQAGLTP
jgi:hypothetical protein